jgi:phosphoadenosine phosphosulfate reductase
MLIEKNLFENIDLVKIAIERLKIFCPPEGYYLAFSGGKDSIVIKKLADMAGVKYDAHYNVTTIDPPDLVRFIRKYHQDVIFNYPENRFCGKCYIEDFR